MLVCCALTRNPTASLEREASHSRVEGRVLDSLLASAHALVDSHSHTASKTSRVKTRALALETSCTYPYKGVGSVWLYPAQLALLVTPKTSATKLPCSPEGQVQCVTNLGEKHCLWAWHNYYASSVKNFSCSAHTCQFFACCSSR